MSYSHNASSKVITTSNLIIVLVIISNRLILGCEEKQTFTFKMAVV